VTVLRARADLYGKRVFYCTNTTNRFSACNIVVYLYCYLDGMRCSWIIIAVTRCMLIILLIQICDPNNYSIVLYLDLSDLLVFLAKAKQECTKRRVTGVLHSNLAAHSDRKSYILFAPTSRTAFICWETYTMSKCLTLMLQPEFFRNLFVFLFSYRLRLPVDFSLCIRYILRMRQSYTRGTNNSKCYDLFYIN